MEVTSFEFWPALGSPYMLLSGENAVLLALASPNLVPQQQKW